MGLTGRRRLPPHRRLVTLSRDPPMKTILVVEDEMKIARLVRDYLEVRGSM